MIKNTRTQTTQWVAGTLAAVTLLGVFPGVILAQGTREEMLQHNRLLARDKQLQREEQLKHQRALQQDKRRQREELLKHQRALQAERGPNRTQVQQRTQDRRQSTKNDWRNLATIAGGLTAFGLIKNDPTLSFVSAAGSLYSLDRYEKDRHSQDQAARVRASLFSEPYLYRDGQRYQRRVVKSKGEKFYQFRRAR